MHILKCIQQITCISLSVYMHVLKCIHQHTQHILKCIHQHTHTHTHTLNDTHTHTRILYMTHTLTHALLCHTQTLSMSHTHTHTHAHTHCVIALKKVAIFPRKALHTRKKNLYLCKRDLHSAKEPYIAKHESNFWKYTDTRGNLHWSWRGKHLQKSQTLAKEPYISAKEPYFSVLAHYISAKEPCISAKEPVEYTDTHSNLHWSQRGEHPEKSHTAPQKDTIFLRIHK